MIDKATGKSFEIITHPTDGTEPFFLVRIDQVDDVEPVLSKAGVRFVRERMPIRAQEMDAFYVLNLGNADNATKAKQALDAAE